VTVIRVVGAVLLDGTKVLACRRAAHKSQAGKWEFPGGKVEDGESLESALLREIKEELNEVVEIADFIHSEVTNVGGLNVELSCFFARFTSKPKMQSIDHDRLVWIELSGLRDLDWSAPDVPAVVKLTELLEFPDFARHVN
jgi:8-oxo-dGTP diphosphatase